MSHADPSQFRPSAIGRQETVDASALVSAFVDGAKTIYPGNNFKY
jgi:hypothetical protein